MATSSRSPIYTALAAAVLFLTLVPLGTSVFVLGFFHGDSPCILCWAQRIGMALVALVGLFILRYGPKPKYVGLGVLVSAYGVFMAIRHSSLHLARDVGQGFAIEMLGAHTYIWSFAVFWVCLIVMALMLMKVPVEDLRSATPRPLRAIDTAAVVSFLVVTAGTIVQAFASTGPPPYTGQSDPVRFSFNPRHWVWSLEEYHSAPMSLRGRWAIEKPDVASVDPSPIAGLAEARPAEIRTLDLGLRGTPTGLDYDAASDRFLLTTEHGVYLLDGDLRTVLRYTVVDPLFAVDLGRFAGAVFLGDGRLQAVTENKSFVVLRETGRPDADRNYRFFLESPNAFEEVSRSRFATLRAKMMYVMSAAFDPATNSIVTITVPNARNSRPVISRFSAADMQISEEFLPTLDGKPLEGVYVTGAAVSASRLYAISAAHSTLLTIDLGSRSVVARQSVSGIAQPTGLAIKGTDLYIVTRAGGLAIVRSII
jgi:disulfide bond formation protein DsbB